MKHVSPVIILVLLIFFLSALESIAQGSASLHVLRKKNDKRVFLVKEGAKVVYTDKEEHTFKGMLRIVDAERIAIGKDTLPLNGFEQFWEQKQVETAIGVGSLALGVGSCLNAFQSFMKFSVADSGSAASQRYACNSVGYCLLGIGLLTGGVIDLARLHKADGEKHKIIVVRKDY